MSKIYYATHPKVVLNPEIPDTQWAVSEEGWKQAEALLQKDFMRSISIIYSSDERKAKETAAYLSDALGVEHKIEDLSGANRSKAGFLSNEDNREAVRIFYSEHNTEPFGWESATSTQKRNISAFERINTAASQDKNILIIGHGDGGTTLICHLLNVPISRDEDQPVPTSYWVYDRDTKQVAQKWQPYSAIETKYKILEDE